MSKETEGDEKAIQWIGTDWIWGDDLDGEQHTRLYFGLQDGGNMVWRKVTHHHPRNCPECGSCTMTIANPTIKLRIGCKPYSPTPGWARLETR